jgi:glycosyltransferase involved in cell wall biosynthesis
MKVLMLSTDMKIFEADSPAAKCMASYSVIADELIILVVGVGQKKETRLAENVRAVAAGGANKAQAFFRALSEAGALAPGVSVVTSQDPFFLGLIGLSIARRFRIPLQIQLHTDCFSPAYRFESLRRFLEFALAKLVVKRASCVRAVSERIARRARHTTGAPVAVLPIRVDAPHASSEKPAACSGAFTLLSVSRLTREKRVDILIHAVALLPGAELVILGEGPERRRLERLAYSLRVSDRIHFEGWKDPAPYYAHARAYVQASRYEGYGMAAMEAALSGLPIIGTDAGLIGSEFKDGEDALVAHADPASFAKLASRLMAEPVLASRLGGSARKTAEGLSVSEEVYHGHLKETFARCLESFSANRRNS